MGNFSINHYANLRVEAGELRVRYRLDLAEIATAQEMPSLDADGDGRVSDAERAAYLAKNVPKLLGGLNVRVDGRHVPLEAVRSDLQLRPGAADLPTMLLTIDCRAPLTASPPSVGARFRILFRDGNYAERAGWREITVRDAPGGKVLATDVARYERSNALETYPPELIDSPPQQRDADLRVQIVAMPVSSSQSAAPAPHAPSARNTATPRDRFTSLISTKQLSLGLVLLSFGVAFALGCFHALSPGHGKTVVAAYLVGSRGTARHAVLLGAVVTMTHVIGVFLLGLAVLFASAYVLPERLYPWLGFGSGLLIVAIGVWQFSRRWAIHYLRSRGIAQPPLGSFDTHYHGPGGHTHDLPDRITPAGLIALGVSGGIVPCPSALIVMLSAIALHRVAFGLVLIVIFSLGLASVLIAIGLLMLYARRLVDGMRWAPGLFTRLPLVSPLVVAALGGAIAAQAVFAGGLLAP